MPIATEIGIAFLAIVALLNVVASVALLRCPFYSVLRKLAQLAIIWFVPLFGAVGIWSFLRSQYNWRKFDTRAFPEGSQKGVAVEVQNAVHDSFGGGGSATD